MNDIDTETGIVAYMHCIHCLHECPEGISPADYSNLSIGVSPHGALIVWCNRHKVAVFDCPGEQVEETLMLAAGTECECCHGKETAH